METNSFFSEEQITVLNESILSGFPEEHAHAFIELCKRVKLDPFAREIYPILRKGRNSEPVLVPVVGIGGLRNIAHRSGEHAGTGPALFTPDPKSAERGVWFDVWTRDGHPFAAKIEVFKLGSTVPTVAVARWDSYVVLDRDGRPSGLWATKGDIMLAKVAEALALRKAFSTTSGLYVPEELGFDSDEPSHRNEIPRKGNHAPRPAQRRNEAPLASAPAPQPGDQDANARSDAPASDADASDGRAELMGLLRPEDIPAAAQVFRSRGFLRPGESLENLSEEAIQFALSRRKAFLAAVAREADMLRATA